MENVRLLFLNAVILEGLRLAWQASRPGLSGGHEEGGFIVQEQGGNYAVLRWPHGTQDEILVPPHPGCQAQGARIVATFHTHPNAGSDFVQDPSEDDQFAVRGDLDLKEDYYLGKIVIADERTYLILPQGQISVIGPTWVLLAITT